MAIQLGNRKQELLLKAHKHEIKDIFNDYNKKEIYTITYEDGVIEKEKYTFSSDALCKKYGLRSGVELIFLLSQGGEYLRKGEFCLKEKYKYNTRSSNDNITCDCKGFCLKCNKPYVHGEENMCHRCVQPKVDYPFNQQYQDNSYSFEQLYCGCMTDWSAKDILEDIDQDQIDDFIALAMKRIKFLKKIRKIME